MQSLGRVALAAACAVGSFVRAHADGETAASATALVADDEDGAIGGRLLDDETFAVRAVGGRLILDGGLLAGAPTALGTGLAKGVIAGVRVGGDTFGWGVRAAYASASEDGAAWAVIQREVRVLATGGVQRRLGRGVVGLRLGLGGTLVHERRVRHQGMRAGLTGDALETRAVAIVPAASLDATIGLHVRGPWMLQLAGGPSLGLVEGAPHGAWAATLGIAWRP